MFFNAYMACMTVNNNLQHIIVGIETWNSTILKRQDCPKGLGVSDVSNDVQLYIYIFEFMQNINEIVKEITFQHEMLNNTGHYSSCKWYLTSK